AGVGAALRCDHIDRWVPADALTVVLWCSQRERLQHAQELVNPLVVAVPVPELAHRGVQRLRDREPHALLGPGFDLAGAPGAFRRHPPQRLQPHRLADAAQPAEYQAALRPAGGDPLEHDLELAYLGVAAGQFRRPLAGTGRVRIPDRVHDRTLWACLAFP